MKQSPDFYSRRVGQRTGPAPVFAARPSDDALALSRMTGLPVRRIGADDHLVIGPFAIPLDFDRMAHATRTAHRLGLIAPKETAEDAPCQTPRPAPVRQAAFDTSLVESGPPIDDEGFDVPAFLRDAIGREPDEGAVRKRDESAQQMAALDVAESF